MVSCSKPAIVFSTENYAYLRTALCTYDTCEAGELEVRTFPDGERYLRILTECIDRDVVVLGGTISDADTLTLYDLACATVGQGARSMTLIIPFFGYQTMETAGETRRSGGGEDPRPSVLCDPACRSRQPGGAGGSPQRGHHPLLSPERFVRSTSTHGG